MSYSNMDTKTIDQLLSYTVFDPKIFDQKFWDQGYLLYEQIKKEYLYETNDKNLIVNDPEFLEYLRTLDQNNSWIQYFLGLSDVDNLVISIQLGNPYAMYLFALRFGTDESISNSIYIDSKIQYIKNLILTYPYLTYDTLLAEAANLGYPQAKITYIQDLVETTEEKTYPSEVKPDLSDFLIKVNQLLADLNKSNLKGYESELARLYFDLSNLFSMDWYWNQVFFDKSLEYLNKSHLSEGQMIVLFPGVIDSTISRYLELRKSYEELKKVKEMDFNGIVSSQVGEFLN